MEAKIRLEQAKKDKGLAIEWADKEIAALEKQIADSEVIYSIGDRFKHCGDKYILAYMGGCKVGLVNLCKGGSFETGVEVNIACRIIKSEFNKVQCGRTYIRYWDARKQEKC